MAFSRLLELHHQGWFYTEMSTSNFERIVEFGRVPDIWTVGPERTYLLHFRAYFSEIFVKIWKLCEILETDFAKIGPASLGQVNEYTPIALFYLSLGRGASVAIIFPLNLFGR